MRLGKLITTTIVLGGLAGGGIAAWQWSRVPSVETAQPFRGPAVQAIYAQRAANISATPAP